MNSEPSIRTISVKYTVVFCVIIGFLFLFSQILDNLFYDYTVIETEIVFIKRVDQSNSKMIIELNEVTEQSNSLVLTLQNNMQSTIEQIYKKINYQINEEEDYTLQQMNNHYRQSFNLISQSMFLRNKMNNSIDSIYLLNIKNTFNTEMAQVDISIYSDYGSNFFDLSQAITLNNFWNEELQLSLQNKIVTTFIEESNYILLVMYDYNNNEQQIALLRDNELEIIHTTNYLIKNIATKNQNIIFNYQNDREIYIYDFNSQKINKIQSFQINNVLYFQVMKLFFFNENTIGVFYLEVTSDKYKIIGMALNEYKNVFLNIDITEEMISLEQIQQIELLYDYNQEHNILIVSFGKKYLYYLKIKPFMFAKQFDQWNPKKIKLNIFEQEKEIFKKIIYDHQDQIIYILSESTQSKLKMHLVDMKSLENKSNKIDTMKLRMPYFKYGVQAIDFHIQKNQINNNVILFLLKNGDVACIQPLQYGEGVLKKTFIIELLDIVLTLSFIGFFRYLKRLLQKIYSKIISCCRRI
ncbi:unnamed protein product [Paramecium primaurelia]|uniref:Transmembrane protein n=1 Tax=Paramecium primaurelia TaxID=5886 RepID=A0A8S1QTW2_PARPR|nr:unnamed protein product [Paramecium primaurelia]